MNTSEITAAYFGNRGGGNDGQALVEKMIPGKVYHKSTICTRVSNEGLRIFLNSKWDPASSGLGENKLVSN